MTTRVLRSQMPIRSLILLWIDAPVAVVDAIISLLRVYAKGEFLFCWDIESLVARLQTACAANRMEASLSFSDIVAWCIQVESFLVECSVDDLVSCGTLVRDKHKS